MKDNQNDTILNLMGNWSMSPVDDGAATDIQIFLLSNGLGAYAEYNWYLIHFADISWKVENGCIVIKSDDEEMRFLNGEVKFNGKGTVTDITGNTHELESISISENKFYKIPGSEKELVKFMNRLRQQFKENEF